MAKGSKFAQAALNTLGNTLVNIGITLAIAAIYKLINAHKELVQSVQAAADKYNEQKQQIDSYSNSIKSLYTTINNEHASTEDQIQARKDLYDIQRQLINQYGDEVSGIDLVTTSLEEQEEVLQRIEDLKKSAQTYAVWRSELEGTNASIGLNGAEKFLYDAKSFGKDVLNDAWKGAQYLFSDKTYNQVEKAPNLIRNAYEKMQDALEEYKNYTTEFSITVDENMNRVIEAYENIERNGNTFEISGNVETVASTLLDIQTRLQGYPGYTESWGQELSGVLATAEGIKKEFQESYKIEMDTKVAMDETAGKFQRDLESAYNEYIQAQASGSAKEVNEALNAYLQVIDELQGSEELEKDVKDYLIAPYIGIMDISAEKLKTTLDVYNEKIAESAEKAKKLGIATGDYVIETSNSLESFVNELYEGGYSLTDILALNDDELKNAYERIKSEFNTNISIEELMKLIFSRSPQLAAQIGEESADAFISSFDTVFESTDITIKTPSFDDANLKQFYDSLLPDQKLEMATWSEEELGKFIELYKKFAKEYGVATGEYFAAWDEYQTGYAERQAAFDQQNAEIFDKFEKTYEDLPTVFGNIDTDTRQILEWTDEALEANKEALQTYYSEATTDWESFKEEWYNSYSTVLGNVDTTSFGVDIAFTPILNTEDGPILMDKGTVYDYIWSLIERAKADDGQWTNEELLKLDLEVDDSDLEYKGHKIHGIIAGIGEDAIAASQMMHYAGLTGSWEDARKHLKAYTDEFPILNAFMVSTGLSVDELCDKTHNGFEESTRQVNAFTKAFKAMKTVTEEATPDSTVPEAVQNYTDKIKPWIDSLGQTYQKIWYTDKGFDINVVDDAMLQDLKSQFDELKKTFNDLDDEALNSFLKTLSDSSTTLEQAQTAFNEYATSLFYTADGIRDMNTETANTMKQMLEKSGVTNFEEIVDHYVKLSEAQKLATESGYDLETMTAAEIKALVLSGEIAEETAQSFYLLALRKALNNKTQLNTVSSVQALYNLAVEAGADILILDKLNEVMSRFAYADQLEAMGATEAAKAYREQTQVILQNALADLQKDLNLTIPLNIVAPDTSNGSGAKETVDAYEEAMKVLQYLRDNDIIDEKHYLDQKKALIDDLWKQGKISAEDYFKHVHDWLREMLDFYNKVISDVTKILNKQKEKLEKERDERIKAIEEERDAQLKALDEETKRIEAKIKIKQKEIDELRKANEERQREIDLQKKLYELARAQYQRVNLVKLCQAS